MCWYFTTISVNALILLARHYLNFQDIISFFEDVDFDAIWLLLLVTTVRPLFVLFLVRKKSSVTRKSILQVLYYKVYFSRKWQFLRLLLHRKSLALYEVFDCDSKWHSCKVGTYQGGTKQALTVHFKLNNTGDITVQLSYFDEHNTAKGCSL